MKERSEEELQAVIDEARDELSRRNAEKRQEVINQIQALAASIDVTVKINYGFAGSASVARVRGVKTWKGGKVPAKYRHPKTGETWSGRGLKPNWLSREIDAGVPIERFLVAA